MGPSSDTPSAPTSPGPARATVQKAPRPFTSTPGRPILFLSGSVAAQNLGPNRWQLSLTRRLSHLPIDILDPWRDDWATIGVERMHNARFAAQTEWELAGLARADVVAVFFDVGAEGSVSLLELGLAVHETKDRLVVCCPEEFKRRGNVEIVCARYGVRLVDSFDELVAGIIEKVEGLRG